MTLFSLKKTPFSLKMTPFFLKMTPLFFFLYKRWPHSYLIRLWFILTLKQKRGHGVIFSCCLKKFRYRNCTDFFRTWHDPDDPHEWCFFNINSKVKINQTGSSFLRKRPFSSGRIALVLKPLSTLLLKGEWSHGYGRVVGTGGRKVKN